VSGLLLHLPHFTAHDYVMHPGATLPIPAHVAGLRSFFPHGTTTWGRDFVNWKGRLSPSDCGRSYGIELNYHLFHQPKVWVRNPNLHEFAGGKPLPHVYDQNVQQLCLYVPGRGYWKPSRSLAVTIVPWTCLWLYYFELWLVTEDFAGKGEHPTLPRAEPPKEPRSKNAILF